MAQLDDKLRTQLLGFFFEESLEGLSTMEAALLAFGEGTPDPEVVNTVFRAMHSIKGSSGSFGLTAISQFAHRAETLLDQVRAGTRPASREVVDVLLETTDRLRGMIERVRAGGDADAAQAADTAAKLELLLGGSAPVHDAVSASAAPAAVSAPARWKIEFAPNEEMLQGGNDPVRILRALAELGELRVEADTARLPALAELDPERCFLAWRIELTSDASEAEVRDPFAWVEDECRLAFTREQREEAQPQSAAPAAEVPRAPAAGAAEPATRSSGSIRVGTDKVDVLVNLVGELVITQSMLSQIGGDPAGVRIERLASGLALLARNTRELQEAVMRIRMLPVSVTFARFPRLVRDLAQQLGKQIELRTAGENTELDKTVLEQLGDPLVHLVRNALDHGLETPAERLAAGKPETGTVTLNAFHQGGNIVIEVSDDGRGLPRERIRAKAIARGLCGADEELSTERIHDLIFAAGFSTAETISDVSGRGVGMDVVRRNIQSLGGSVAVHSVEGKGSTFTICLPLTLAIVDGQLVRVGDDTYVVPLVSIVESLVVKRELVSSIVGRVDVYRLRNEAIPIVRLWELFGSKPDREDLDGALLVIVEGRSGKGALLVDELLGQQQVVVKSLGHVYARTPGISGATILGDGTVALILDVPGVIDTARGTQRPRARARTESAAREQGEAA